MADAGGGSGARRRSVLLVLVVACVLLLLARPAANGQNPDVDLALVLAIDCSDSVDDAEYRQQLDGLARAFRNPAVVGAIHDGPNQRIAVTVFEWSNPRSPVVVVDWMIVDSAASAEAIARKIERARRLVVGGTSLSTAIDTGSALLVGAPFRASRSVIDISSDGINNTGTRPDEARDRAVALGYVVNGLAILNEVPYLVDYFENHVIGGNGKFVVESTDYLAYERAILKKLLREIVRPLS